MFSRLLQPWTPLAPRTANRLTIIFLILLPPVFFWRETLGWLTLGEADAVFWFFPIYKLVAEQVRSGHLPLWNPYLYSGMPLFAEWEPGVLDPLNWIYLLGATSRTMTIAQEAAFSISLLSTYAYARSLNLKRRASVVAAVIYALSGFAVARTIYPGFLHIVALTPLVLWFVERLYRERSWRDVAGGGLVVTWQIVAGHPQPLVYSSLLAAGYALFCALWRRDPQPVSSHISLEGPADHQKAVPLTGKERFRFLTQCAAMFAAGAALAAVQLIPAWEFARQSVRQSVSYEFFTWHSLHPFTLLATLFPFLHGQGKGIYHLPYWGPYWHHNEAQIYLGTLALSLAIAGALYAWRERLRVGMFWSLVGVSAAILSLGKYAGPIARVLYHVPLLGSFRSPNRHWMGVTLAVAMLAGYSVDRLLRTEARAVAWCAQITAGALAVLCCLAGAFLLWHRELAVRIVRAMPDLSYLPQGLFRQAGAEFYLPIISALFLLLGLIVFTQARRRQRWYTLLLGLLLLDFNLYAAFAPISNPAKLETLVGQAMPSELAAKRSERELLRYHVLLEPGSSGFSPFWFYGYEMATGYDPLASARYKTFSGFDEAGRSHLPSQLDPQDRTLDLLNVRYLLLPPDSLDAPAAEGERVEYGGIAFANGQSAAVDLRAGQSGTFSASKGKGDTLAIISTLTDSGEVGDGEEVAEVTVQCGSGPRFVTALRAGRDTSEWAYDRPDVRHLVRHSRATVAESWPGDDAASFQGHSYLSRILLPPTLAGCDSSRSVRIKAKASGQVTLSVKRLALFDPASGRSTPLVSTISAGLRDAARWRQLTSDRPVPGYQRPSVYENLQALPRAWLVNRVEPLAEGEQLRRIRGETLDSQGRPFDPRVVALVEPEAAVRLDRSLQEPAETKSAVDEEGSVDEVVRVVSRRPDVVVMEAEVKRPSMLVLSEVALPGWRVKVDGSAASPWRVNFILQGVPLFPGQHRVEFFYWPRSLLAGEILSAVAAFCLLVMAIWGKRVRFR